MTAPTVTIDLGFADSSFAATAEDERAPGLARGWGLLLMLAAVALVTTAVPVPPPPRAVARIQLGIGDYALRGSTLYLLESALRQTSVTAVNAADGQERWHYAPAGDLTFTDVHVVGDSVVFSSDSCTSGGDGAVAAVDADTGTELWHGTGAPLDVPGDGPLEVITEGAWFDRCGAMLGNGRPTTGPLTWRGVDRRTGIARWERTVPRGTVIALDGSPDGIGYAALVDPADRLSVVDLATGRVSPPVGGLVTRAERWFLATLGLVLYARWAPEAPSRLEVTALDRRTLAPRWTALVPAMRSTSSDRDDGVQLRTCGPLVCVVTATGTVALDAAAGTRRWTAPRAGFTAVPGGLLADYTIGAAGTVGPVRLTDLALNRVVVHDPATGRRTAFLDGWRLLGADAPRNRLMIGETLGDATVLTWLTPAGLQPFAVVAGRHDSCQISIDRLACVTNVDDLWLLELRSSQF
jgi:outer membrane protein assembly factor BamB